MSRFDPFHRIDVPYRSFATPASSENETVPLETTILIPKTLLHPRQASLSVPILVHWHGGAFIVGHRTYEPWFAQWFLDLALAKNAILISPDYRLLPEAKGDDVFDDVACFWRWLGRDSVGVFTAQEAVKSSHLVPDLERVITAGCSAGGVLAIYSGINLPGFLSNEESKVKIQCSITVSAPLDISSPSMRIPRPRTFMGVRPPPPREAEITVRNYIKSIPPGAIRTGSEPDAEMWRLVLCVAQQGYLPRFFQGGKGWDIKAALESVAARDGGNNKMPPVWVVHSEGDTMIPSTCSTGFVKLAETILPDTIIRVDTPPGDHLFDVDLGLSEPWIKDGVEGFLEKHWQ